MEIQFEKYVDGLVPAIVQDSTSGRVLMLGFMNKSAFEKTIETRRVTFFSRSRQELWTKGETSGNFLDVESTFIDCDSDTILIKARPHGPTCHNGTDTCFGEDNRPFDFLYELEATIRDRKVSLQPGSYTAELFGKGIEKIAQKVGEEAVETVIESIGDNKDRLKEECADLIFHLLVLLAEKEVRLSEVVDTLKNRAR